MTALHTVNTSIGHSGPVGVFDSGYGGLTILRELRQALPEADFLYLGDNARAPYGSRSFEMVYRFTLEAVEYLFSRGCPLIILACNTASAKALRSIQQRDLERIAPGRRVLGVIRPTAEAVGERTRTRHVGLVATEGTVVSRSYDMELAKLAPDICLTSRACPQWVPLVESHAVDSPEADTIVGHDIEALLAADPAIDTIILGCTHYPLLFNNIRRHTPPGVDILVQGDIVAASLTDYLSRHPEIDSRISRGGSIEYLTTGCPDTFAAAATVFMGADVPARHVDIAAH